MIEQPAMRAQREGGSERAAVVNLSQADLMGDGIDYTVRGTGGESPVVPEDVKSGTVPERGRLGQMGRRWSAALSSCHCEIQARGARDARLRAATVTRGPSRFRRNYGLLEAPYQT